MIILYTVPGEATAKEASFSTRVGVHRYGASLRGAGARTRRSIDEPSERTNVRRRSLRSSLLGGIRHVRRTRNRGEASYTYFPEKGPAPTDYGGFIQLQAHPLDTVRTSVGAQIGALRAPQPRRISLAELVVESYFDGCIGEGLAAEAARGAHRNLPR